MKVVRFLIGWLPEPCASDDQEQIFATNCYYRVITLPRACSGQQLETYLRWLAPEVVAKVS